LEHCQKNIIYEKKTKFIYKELSKSMSEKFIRFKWEDFEDRQRLIDMLKEKKVVISSTDTIYGILSDVAPQCYDAICELKRVEEKRPFLILVSSVEKLSYFVDSKNLSVRIVKFVMSCWPGPVTVIFKSRDGGTVAIRCPKHDGLLSILPEFNGLFSTSANRAGGKTPRCLEDIDLDLLHEVGYVVTDSNKSCGSGLPSTIVDISDGELRLVRSGAFPIEKLKELYEQSRQN
jgi:tRNA threonylcarbamoyl adenosine modification protein (Sua5/YciO/YrdC/YwlC family)